VLNLLGFWYFVNSSSFFQVTRFVMDDSAPGNDDHTMLIESRKISPATGWSFSPNSVPIRGGGTNNTVNTGSTVSCGRTFCLETACGPQADFEAAVGAQDEHQRNKTHFDWPEVGSLLKTNLRYVRNLNLRGT
jgi:hypothetical protein